MDYVRKVSVILPVYNCEEYIKECVTSILSQTFTDFELLIVNDYCNDKTMEIISEFEDNRVRILHNPGDKGISESLNFGIANASGEYIARMDSDDICLNNRIRHQVDFLDRYPEIGVLGSRFKEFGLRSKIIKLPKFNDEILSEFFAGAILCHPSVMIRKELFNHFLYKKRFDAAEDYRLWIDMAIGGVRFHILEDVLILKRAHQNRISVIERTRQLTLTETIRKDYFKHKFKFLNSTEIEAICLDNTTNRKIDVAAFNSTLSKIVKFSERKSSARKDVEVIFRDTVYRINPHLKFKEFRILMSHMFAYKALTIVDILRLFKRTVFLR